MIELDSEDEALLDARLAGLQAEPAAAGGGGAGAAGSYEAGEEFFEEEEDGEVSDSESGSVGSVPEEPPDTLAALLDEWEAAPRRPSPSTRPGGRPPHRAALDAAAAPSLRLGGGVYSLRERLGSGFRGLHDVYLATDDASGASVAVKLEPAGLAPPPGLLHECKLVRRLAGRGVPELLCAALSDALVDASGARRKYACAVMRLLGPSLENLCYHCRRRIGLRALMPLAEQMLQRLEHMHALGFVHKDVKPANFMLGAGDRHGTPRDLVYIIDFGITESFVDDVTGELLPPTRGNGDLGNMMGTGYYAPLAAHLGRRQFPRDDLEGLGYTLLHLARGWLPWGRVQMPRGDNRARWVAMGEHKRDVRISALCEGVPPQFRLWFKHLRKLRHGDEPDYQHLSDLLFEMFEDALDGDEPLDGEWPWVEEEAAEGDGGG